MLKLPNHVIGVDQGNIQIFSDFENKGEMWAVHGARSRRIRVDFSEEFKSLPAVHVSISMFDIDNSSNQRADIIAENVEQSGFDILFKTWGDTKIARIRAAWMAIGEVQSDDDWTLD